MKTESLRRLLDAHAGATAPGPRAALDRALRGENAMAIADAHHLHTLLEKQWAWLEEHPNAERFAEREEAFLANLATYEALESAIGEAAARVGVAIPEAAAWKADEVWAQAYRVWFEAAGVAA